MSPARERLLSARRWLRAIVALRAVLWAAAAATLVVAARLLLGRADAAVWTMGTALAASGAAGIALWRAAPSGVTMERAALWIEAHVPALRYALVTLADDDATLPPAAARALDAQVQRARWDDALRRATLRAVAIPLGIVLVTVAATRALPHASTARASGASGPRAAARSIDRLARVRVTVTPPAYSGLRAQTLNDPTALDALVGSSIALDGDGDPVGLSASMQADSGGAVPTRVVPNEAGWRVALAMPERPAALRLTDGHRTRLYVLAPRVDAPPRVTLALPARDTVLRDATGTLPLSATADDDLGLASAQFEWIISSGEGESFKFSSGVAGRVALGGAQRGTLRASITLASLGLKPGDLVHLRAVARDRNPAPDRGPGASETRTIRIARPGEYDSVAVDAAPPVMGDTSQLGQRMILQLTEALVKRQRTLTRPVVLAESQKIAVDQARLRKRVGSLVFQRLGESEGEETSGEAERREKMTPDELLAAASEATGQDMSKPLEGDEEESPIVAVNKVLLEAYNHMWDAGRALEVGEPAKAIPPMRLAIIALQKARAKERIYLRGKPPAAVVDLAKVRLAVKLAADTMHPADRSGRAALDAKAKLRLASLGRAVGLLPHDASAAADTLALLRVDALGDAPALAAALGDAEQALRNGRDATSALVRSRRLAAGITARIDALGAWAW